MLELYAPMFIMFAIVAVICTVMFAGGHFVGPKNPTPEKVMPFECGNDTPGARDVKMNVKFYLTAILFVVFDVEVVFMKRFRPVAVHTSTVKKSAAMI